MGQSLLQKGSRIGNNIREEYEFTESIGGGEQPIFFVRGEGHPKN